MLNKIYNEDCMIGIKKIPDNFIDLVIIDPPYQINNHNVKYDSDLARSINSYNDELYKSNLTGGYDYNKYINDKDRRILDIAVSLAKHIIVIYNGKIDIKTDSDKNIEVTIELNLDKDIKNYKSRVRDDNDEFIYQKYLNMCNF